MSSILSPLRESTLPPPRALEETPHGSPSHLAGSLEGGSTEGPSPFARLVHRLGDEVTRGEAVVEGALRAAVGVLGPAELIALQAGIYRYSEAVDLAAKLVDHATTGIKTILQGQ